MRSPQDYPILVGGRIPVSLNRTLGFHEPRSRHDPIELDSGNLVIPLNVPDQVGDFVWGVSQAVCPQDMGICVRGGSRRSREVPQFFDADFELHGITISYWLEKSRGFLIFDSFHSSIRPT